MLHYFHCRKAYLKSLCDYYSSTKQNQIANNLSENFYIVFLTLFSNLCYSYHSGIFEKFYNNFVKFCLQTIAFALKQ